MSTWEYMIIFLGCILFLFVISLILVYIMRGGKLSGAFEAFKIKLRFKGEQNSNISPSQIKNISRKHEKDLTSGENIHGEVIVEDAEDVKIEKVTGVQDSLSDNKNKTIDGKVKVSKVKGANIKSITGVEHKNDEN